MENSDSEANRYVKEELKLLQDSGMLFNSVELVFTVIVCVITY